MITSVTLNKWSDLWTHDQSVKAINIHIILIDDKQNMVYLKGNGRPLGMMKKVAAKYGIDLETW